MEKIAKQMDAKFIGSFYRHTRRSVTVHPLGGCPMGRTPYQGVVDSHGEVFNYPGFFIADGSVMPGPVGPNPSLTIAALADRFADKVICNYESKRTFLRSDQQTANRYDPTTLRFTEVLRGYISHGERDYARGYQAGRDEDSSIHARLTIYINGVNRFVADPQHRAGVGGHVRLGAHGEHWRVERGDINLFNTSDAPGVLMRYWLYLRAKSGATYTLVGVKRVPDGGNFELWRDTSTLYVHLLHGHVEPEQMQDSQIAAAGKLDMSPIDVLKELTTFRATGPIWRAIWGLGAMLTNGLWKLYRARP
jgi:cholesterol oxidase